MRINASSGLAAGIFAMLLSSTATSAWAQPTLDAAALDGSDGLDTIVVTARRRSEALQNVPVTVSVMNAETLEQRGVRSEADLQVAFPGLVIRSSNNNNQLNYVIRGESVDAYSGSPPGVQPYVNDVPFLVSQSTAFFDLENIQVVKGPQGTLFGRNSTGGAVLFQTKQPEDAFGGYASVQYGNLNRLITEAAINLPIAGDRAALRIAGSVTSGGAYVRNLFDNAKLGDKQERSGRITLKLQPVDGLTNVTMAQFSRARGTNAPNTMYFTIPCGDPSGFNSCLYSPSNPDFLNLINGISLPGYPNGYVFPGGFQALPEFLRSQGDYVVNANADFKYRSRSDLIINRTELELSDTLSVKNIFGYSRTINRINYDTDYSPYPIIGQNAPTLLPGFPRDIETGRTRTYSNEFQIAGNSADERLTYLAGLFYIRSKEDYLSPLVITTLAPPVISIPVAYHALSGNTSKAIFGQATYKLTDQTNITVGGRYTWEKITLRQLARSLFGPGNPQRAKQDSPSWTVSLDHHFSREVMTYITTRGSWRRGGFNPFNPPTPTPQTPATGAGGNYFLPEKIIDVEAGIKFDGRLGEMPVRANIAVYNNWVKNIQKTAYVVVAGTASSAAVNVPRSKITGVEGELYMRPSDWLSLGGSVTYTNARFTKNQSIVFGLPVAYGPFGDVPKWSGTLFADATYELPDDVGTLNYHVDVYGQSHFYFSNLAGTIQPGTKLPSYALVNMRLDWANMFGSNVKTSLFVKNLTDKLYYTGGSAGAQNFSVESATFGSPRTYGVAVRVDF